MSGRLVGGKYKLVRMLGRGGMGEVHEATHTTTGRRVALKLLTANNLPGDEEDSIRREEVLARFAREARAAGQINSPYVVEVLDASFDEATRLPFMVMEYLTGEDLQRVLKRTGPLPVQTALKITAQALCGLARAHVAGVVHRDIKPANLFLAHGEGNLTIKVVDFGIARVDGKNDGEGDITQDLTRTGSMLGSPTYMSPEQARGLRQIDARADLWSLGIVLYKMLTGRTPHERGEGGLGELLIAICCIPTPPIQNFAPWVSADVAAVVQRALTIDVQQRFTSADEMLAVVLRLLPGGYIDLRQDDLSAGVSEADKSYVAARGDESLPSATYKNMPPIPAHDATAGDRTRMTMAGDERSAPRPTTRSSTSLVVGTLALGVLASIAAGVGWWAWHARTNRILQERAVAAASAPSVRAPNAAATAATSASASSLSAAAARDAARSVAIEVPEGASVEVDGLSCETVDNQVAITGGLGTPHKLRIQRGTQDKTFDVNILVAGASLTKVDFDTANKLPAAALAGKSSATGVAAKTAATNAAAAGTVAGLNRKFE